MNPVKEVRKYGDVINEHHTQIERLRKAGYVSLACNLIAFVLLTIFYVMLL